MMPLLPMKYTYNLICLIGIAITISSCNAQITATTEAFSVQNTAAVLTATPMPPTVVPTETPIPTVTQSVVLATETPTEIQSLEATVTATLTGSTSGNTNPCNKLLQTISGGKPAKIKIENNSGSPITVSLFLNTTPFGDCGYRGYALGKYGSILITDLVQACYNVSVLIDNPKKQIKAFDYGCINNPDKWTFIVSKDTVMLQGR
jgi:hypothetical protein